LTEYFGITTFVPKYLRNDLTAGIAEWSAQEIRLIKESDHPYHTAERNAARNIMLKTIIKHKCRPYTVQWAPIDRRDPRCEIGDHAHVTVRDLETPTRLDVINVKRDIVVITDTDYYIDPLKYAGAHVLIYTQRFDDLAYQDGEVAWEFTDKSKVRFAVQGGSTYEHEVWDYDRDWVTAPGTWLTNTAARLVHYRVDKFRLRYGMIVHLRPMFITNDWTSWQDWPLLRTRLPWFGAIKADPLQRVQVATSTNYLSVTRTPVGGRATTHIRLKGHVGVAKIDAAALGVVASRAGTTATKIELHTIEQILSKQPNPPPNLQEAASYVLGILREGLVPTANLMSSEASTETLYEIYNPDKACDAEMPSPHVVLAAPLIESTPAVTPVATAINEEVAIAERVVKISVDAPVTPAMKSRINEFVDALLGKHTPAFSADYDVVFARQDTDAKRTIFNRAQQICASEAPLTTNISSFMKKEAMSEVKDPRVISPMTPIVKCQAAALLYSDLELWMKEQPWYMFNEPQDIERKITDMQTRKVVAWLLCTDFSRMDGRYWKVGRLLEQTFLKRFFHNSVHHHIDELYEHLLRTKGRGMFGTEFNSLYARLSGEMFTSIMNTLWNAFIMFVAFRQGAKMKTAEAINSLGGYGGDDGFTPNMEKKWLDDVATEYHQKLEHKKVTKEEGCFDFLGRWFSWSTFYGEANSCIDVLRQLPKLHIGRRTPAFQTQLEHLDAKVASFLHTDADAPVLGAWCKKYASFRPGVSKIQPEAFTRYAAKTSSKFRQMRADWMAKMCYPIDVDTVEASIADIKSLSQLLKTPITNPIPRPEPKFDHVVRGHGLVKGKETFKPTPRTVTKARAKRARDCSL
jgi:hypothetical protein